MRDDVGYRGPWRPDGETDDRKPGPKEYILSFRFLVAQEKWRWGASSHPNNINSVAVGRNGSDDGS